MIAKWQNKEYKLLDSVEINKSSREVAFSDIKVDFERNTIDDIPKYMQEIKVISEENKILFTGYVDRVSLPELRIGNEKERYLNISMLTPRALTTKRIVTVITTDKIDKVLNQILAPLYEDGFNLTRYNVKNRNITVKFISKTIEECLNILSNKLGLYWNIDELKNIEISDIDYLFNKEADEINESNYKEKIKGFQYLLPTIEGYNYANIINIKNARVFIEEDIKESFTLKQNDTYTFPHPIDISLKTAKRVASGIGLFSDSSYFYILNLSIVCDKNPIVEIRSNLNEDELPGNDNQEIENISTEDKDEKIFTLQMDSMFKNLATGITYKGEGSVTITRIYTQTALRYANMKLLNWAEIEKNANKITPSGQIEKTIDIKESWYTTQELIEYVRSQFTINNNYLSDIEIICDENNDFRIGDRKLINLPSILTQGNFIITDISESKEWNNPTIYTIKLRNTNILENYIDLFRENNAEEQESQIEVEYVVEHAEEDVIEEKHIIEVDINKENHTLNFGLR